MAKAASSWVSWSSSTPWIKGQSWIQYMKKSKLKMIVHLDFDFPHSLVTHKFGLTKQSNVRIMRVCVEIKYTWGALTCCAKGGFETVGRVHKSY